MSRVESIPAIPTSVPARFRLAATLVLRSLAGLGGGPIAVELPDGTRHLLGDGRGAELRLTIKDWRCFWRVLTAADIGAGEAYMAGEFECNDLVELCRRFVRSDALAQSGSVLGTLSRLRHAWLRMTQANTLAGSRRNIKYHYDLGNDLYRLFLDESMMYSCAVFEDGAEDLEAAQQHKIDDICRRLGLKPGMRILEIGSGWGGFAIHAARHYGCRVTSITLSDEQLRLARQRAAAAGVADRVEIRLCDYRRVEERYDRIVSIEMFEAVGYEYYGAFFGACARVLDAGGRMLLQTITIPDQQFDRYRRDFDFMKKYIFPGGVLASLHAITAAIKKHTDLRIDWLRDIGPHYARTLRCWRERFMNQLPAVRRLGFDDRFIRMWEFYLASCEASFSVRHIGDLQMVLVKAGKEEDLR